MLTTQSIKMSSPSPPSSVPSASTCRRALSSNATTATSSASGASESSPTRSVLRAGKNMLQNHYSFCILHKAPVKLCLLTMQIIMAELHIHGHPSGIKRPRPKSRNSTSQKSAEISSVAASSRPTVWISFALTKSTACSGKWSGSERKAFSLAL